MLCGGEYQGHFDASLGPWVEQLCARTLHGRRERWHWVVEACASLLASLAWCGAGKLGVIWLLLT